MYRGGTDCDHYDSPHLLIDPANNRVGLLFDRRGWSGADRQDAVYWESVLTFYEDGAWTPLLPMPKSWGRISARPAADFDQNGNLWVVWPTDERRFRSSNEPVVGNLYAARIPLQGSPGAPLLQEEKAAKKIEVAQGHLDEPGDVRAIRSYRTFVGVSKSESCEGTSTATRSFPRIWAVGGTGPCTTFTATCWMQRPWTSAP